MTKKEAIKKSIKHWEEMIEWVEKITDKSRFPDSEKMERAIQQDWFTEYCSLCQKYTCETCPLTKQDNCCNDDEKESLWLKVRKSPSWETWLYHAKNMLKALRLLKK